MIVKVFFKGKTRGVLIKTPRFNNSFLLQNWLNEKYGLTGWEGFEIMQD